jgi:hypothetical protein
MTTRNTFEPTLARFARHLYARRGVREATVQSYVATIRRLASVIGLELTPKSIEQHIERMRKVRASCSHIVTRRSLSKSIAPLLGAHQAQPLAEVPPLCERHALRDGDRSADCGRVQFT